MRRSWGEVEVDRTGLTRADPVFLFLIAGTPTKISVNRADILKWEDDKVCLAR